MAKYIPAAVCAVLGGVVAASATYGWQVWTSWEPTIESRPVPAVRVEPSPIAAMTVAEEVIDKPAPKASPPRPIIKDDPSLYELVRKRHAPTGALHARQDAVFFNMVNHLHAQASAQFVRQPGMGLTRMPPMLRVVPREWKLPEWTSEELAKEPPAFRGLKDMNLMHRQSLKFFADSNTISERERTDVALKAGPQTTEQMWEIKSLDLVGVVMHEAPVVYVSEKLPAMDQLSQRPTREPDLFESEGLEELMNGKDLYIRSKDSTVRVLGPLKAGKACLKCHHDSKEGDVLGAFSYTLRPADDRWQVRDGRGLPPGVSGQPALKK